MMTDDPKTADARKLRSYAYEIGCVIDSSIVAGIQTDEAKKALSEVKELLEEAADECLFFAIAGDRAAKEGKPNARRGETCS